MSEKTFYVGKDDLSASKLDYIDINQIITFPRIDYSPLSLQDRIMPDSSVLWIHRTMVHSRHIQYFLTCYEYMRRKGGDYSHVDYNCDQQAYECGPELWSICANYIRGYSLGNEPFRAWFEVYDGGIDDHFTFSLESVNIRDKYNKLSEFAEYYLKLKESFNHPQNWMDLKLAMIVKCRCCGHAATIGYGLVSSLFLKGLSLDNIKSRLKCNECDEKGRVEFIPAYSVHTPKSLMHTSVWSAFKSIATVTKEGITTVRLDSA